MSKMKNHYDHVTEFNSDIDEESFMTGDEGQSHNAIKLSSGYSVNKESAIFALIKLKELYENGNNQALVALKHTAVTGTPLPSNAVKEQEHCKYTGKDVATSNFVFSEEIRPALCFTESYESDGEQKVEAGVILTAYARIINEFVRIDDEGNATLTFLDGDNKQDNTMKIAPS